MTNTFTSLSSNSRLALLYRFSRIFNQSLNLEDVLHTVMEGVFDVTRIERCVILLRELDGELSFRIARGLDEKTYQGPRYKVARGIVEHVAQRGQPVLTTNDAQKDILIKEQSDSTILELISILCVPIRLKKKILGVIYVENHFKIGVFNQRDMELLISIAELAARAIENARLFQEAQDSIQNLRLLHKVNADLTATLDLERVLTACVQRIQDNLAAEAGSILTIEGDELVFQIALGEKADQIKPFRIPLGHGVAGWVVQNRESTIVNDIQNDPRFYSNADDKTGFFSQNVMAAPLVVNQRAIGVIEVFNKPGGFSKSDLDLLSSIASGAAIAIENARLYKVAVEKGRMERELEMARKVQISLLPSEIPQIQGWEFAARWLPAHQVAGDYYDIISIERPTYISPQLGLVIADVTDKGMPAALFMAFTRSIVRAGVIQAASPEKGITHANRLICAESTKGLFVTLFYAQLDPETGTFSYVNAGHNPPLFCQAKQDELTELMPTGIPLGVDGDSTFESQELNINFGDFIIFYTDGVTEAINSLNQDFGMERLKRVVRQNKLVSAEAIVTAIISAVDDFTASNHLFDDTTILVAKRLPEGTPSDP